MYIDVFLKPCCCCFCCRFVQFIKIVFFVDYENIDHTMSIKTVCKINSITKQVNNISLRKSIPTNDLKF